jgi:hypothetical protein
LEVGAVGDHLAAEMMDSTLRDKMKGELVWSHVELNSWLQQWTKFRQIIVNWILQK